MDTHDVIAEVSPASAYYIERVKRKLATGVYPLESVACFCGRMDGQMVSSTDRYGFVHPMVVCPSCGLIYAKERMTADAYRQFYEQEYRQIYGADDNDAKEARMASSRGQTLLDFIRDKCDRTPQVVFELGCKDGAMLEPFAEAGCTVHGCDYNAEPLEQGRVHGLPLYHGGLEQLEMIGTKADLIILSHVLEHCLDIEDTLIRLAALLNPQGILFIEVPGLYQWDKSTLWQNAHVWQFTAESLAYVMNCCGFEEVYANQKIESLWQYTGDCIEKEDVPLGAARQILQFLQHGARFVPEIRTVNKFPLADRKQHMRHALNSDYPDIHELVGTLRGRSAIVIGGGPSADLQTESVERLRAEGAVTVCIERMLPWCLKHKFIPDYVVAMDASDDVVEALHTLPSTSHYLVATQCQPAVFEKLRGLDVSIYTTPQRGIELDELWTNDHRPVVTKINSGGSVTLCAMSLAMTFGCCDLHIMGFDCHVSNGGYANGIAGVGEQDGIVEVSMAGHPRRYQTTVAYLSFAQQFFKLMKLGHDAGVLDSVTVYGDTLIRPMHRVDGPLKDVVRV